MAAADALYEVMSIMVKKGPLSMAVMLRGISKMEWFVLILVSGIGVL